MTYLNDRDPAGARLVSERIGSAVGLLARRPIGRPTKMSGVFVKLVARTSYALTYSTSAGELTVLSLIHQRRQNAPGGRLDADEGP